MKVLVIYQNIPESTNVHIIEADGEDLEILKKMSQLLCECWRHDS